MAQAALAESDHHALPSTLATSYLPAHTSASQIAKNGIEWHVDGRHGGRWYRHGDNHQWREYPYPSSPELRTVGLGSTGKGILIGMLSAFGSAALVGLIIAVVYFFRYTNRGRIFLDRISRPGEYDDEQSFLREEEDALADMDELQRSEYFRAKGEVFVEIVVG